jgi:hypothetical protein
MGALSARRKLIIYQMFPCLHLFRGHIEFGPLWPIRGVENRSERSGGAAVFHFLGCSRALSVGHILRHQGVWLLLGF